MKKITKLLGRSVQLSLLALLCHTTALAANYTVDRNTDGATDGSYSSVTNTYTGSLRYCITNANNDASSPTIKFAIPGGGVQQIVVTSQITITKPMKIDGYSQLGASNGSIATRNLTVQIISPPPGPLTTGDGMLTVRASNTTICGINFITFLDGAGGGSTAIGHGESTSEITSNVWVWGCNFGTNAAGTATYANQAGLAIGVYGATDGTASGSVPGGGHKSTISGWIIGTNGDNNNDAVEGNIFSGQVPTAAISFETIRLINCDNFIIAGNYFGLQKDGVSALQAFNAGGTKNNGMSVTNCTGTRIGTNGDGVSDIAERNIFVGIRGSAVLIQGNGATNMTYYNDGNTYYSCRPAGNNLVAGNYFGTDKNGTGTGADLQNLNGVKLWTTTTNTVGGSTAALGNVIVNSTKSGVLLTGNGMYGNNVASQNNTVTGNIIGVLADSSTPSPNAVGVALNTDDGTPNTLPSGYISASNNTISNNIIAYNTGGGVQVRPASNGVKVYDNTITQNTIYGNAGLGINLGSSTSDVAVTGNNGLLSAASGSNANLLMNYGIVKSASLSGNNLTISGFIGNSVAGSSAFGGAKVEFFIANNSPADQNGERFSGDGKSMAHGEGQTYLGSLTADANGLFNGTLNVSGKGVVAGTLITNTATSTSGSTSEFGVDFTAVSVAGTVVDDYNGLIDSKISGTGTNASGTLYAVLYDNTLGTVIDVVQVAANGTFSFTGAISGEDYTIYETTTSVTKGQTAVPTIIFPNNWVTIGEVNCGTTPGCMGSDGTPDGKLNIGVLSGDNTQATFGLDQRPTSNNISQAIPNPGANNKIPAGTVTTNVSGTDPEQGALTGGTIVINTLPTNSTMSYNGTVITAGTVIVNFDPTKVSYDNIAGGSTSTTFKYSIEDAANVPSGNSANFTVNWPTALPLKLISFTGNRNNGNDILSWTIAQEKNTSYFEVQYSTDGQNFTAIGKVDAANNSTTAQQYSYVHSDVNGNAVYRLKMVDLDGSYSFSAIVKLSSGAAPAASNVTMGDIYPVPFTDVLNVAITSDKDQSATLLLYNMNGSVVARYSMPLQQGSNTYHLGNLEMLAPGGYLLQVHTNSGVVTRQIMKK